MPRLFKVLFAVLLLILLLPLLGLLIYLGQPDAWQVLQHQLDTVLPRYALTTLILLVGVAGGAGLMGTGAAWMVATIQFPGRTVLSWLLILPLAMPTYVMAYAFTDFFQFAGWFQSTLRALYPSASIHLPDIRSIGGAILIFSLAFYPYVYMLSRTAFLERSPSVGQVARSLGYNQWRVFFKITLPLARPAVIAGLALALMETLADFGAVSYFGINTLTTGIYRAWFALGDRIAASQMASLVLVLVFMLVWIEQVSRGRARYFSNGQRVHNLPQRPVAWYWAWLATVLSALPVLFGFVLPVAILVHVAWREAAWVQSATFLPRLGQWVWHSLTLASLTSSIVIVIAVSIAYLLRGRTAWWTGMVQRLITLGYAVPGTVLAVGILLPLGWIDALLSNGLTQLNLTAWLPNATWATWATSVTLTGTLFGLLYAYLVRFFSVGYQSIQTGLQKITLSMDASAKSMGVSGLKMVRRIHVPLLWRSVLTSALLVFVDVMKELPATLILRPFNYDTLAVITWQLAADERLGEAAIPALMIVLVSTLPVILLSRAISKGIKKNNAT
jgi:iron(III) transport system permease protein